MEQMARCAAGAAAGMGPVACLLLLAGPPPGPTSRPSRPPNRESHGSFSELGSPEYAKRISATVSSEFGEEVQKSGTASFSTTIWKSVCGPKAPARRLEGRPTVAHLHRRARRQGQVSLHSAGVPGHANRQPHSHRRSLRQLCRRQARRRNRPHLLLGSRRPDLHLRRQSHAASLRHAHARHRGRRRHAAEISPRLRRAGAQANLPAPAGCSSKSSTTKNKRPS